MAGAKLREAYPVVPLAEGHTLSIGMFSYRDWMHFGLYADPEALPEVRRLPGRSSAHCGSCAVTDRTASAAAASRARSRACATSPPSAENMTAIP